MSTLTAGATGRPEPVLDAAKVAAAVSGTVLAIGTAFVLIGWATADQVQSWAVIAGGIVTAIGALIAVVLPIITAYGARAQVTPLADPRGMQGQVLPITPGYPTISIPPVAPDQPVPPVAARDADDIPSRPAAWPLTTPITAVGAWTPPTPTTLAAEPTPIEAEAVAATSGRRTPASAPTT
jgi:hypothetical protein